MRAFVLSGGGNLGPLQVGALRALLDADIKPQMLVGCSAGALNCAYLAREFSTPQLERLADVWRDVRTQDVYPGHLGGVFWRFVTGQDSLYDNRNFYAFLQRHGTTPAHTFAHARYTKLYITATHLRTGRLHVFGDNPHDRILDALMASTALTPMHPPWEIQSERYIDGGTVTPLPLRVALERGATEIYSLHIKTDHVDSENEQATTIQPVIRGIPAVLTRSIITMLHLQAQHDLMLAEVAKRVRLHYLLLTVPTPPPATDFSHADELIDAGYTLAQAYLTQRKGTHQAVANASNSWQRMVKRLRNFSKPKVAVGPLRLSAKAPVLPPNVVNQPAARQRAKSTGKPV